MNRYAYTLNNPVKYTDPLGLDVCIDDGYDTGNADGSGGVQHIWKWTCLFRGPTGNGGLETGGNGGKGNPTAPNKKNVFTCASNFASTYSAAGFLHKYGMGVNAGIGGLITDALGGNTFSSATDLIQSIGSGQAGGHSVFYNMAQGVAAGPTQGFGALAGKLVNGTPFQFASTDLAISAGYSYLFSGWQGGVGSAKAFIGTFTGEGLEFASGVGEIKLGIDAGVYALGLARCAAGK